MGQLISGNDLAQEIQAEAGQEVQRLRAAGVIPNLAVVIVGEDPASQIYVRNKVRTSLALGIRSERIELPASSTTGDVLSVVEQLNKRGDIHGILVQVPMPRQIDARKVLNSILPEKDVDGFHPVNIGRLVSGNAILKPCTPAGILEIFKRRNIPLVGSRAVVIGRSDIVGKPVAIMLLHEHATVTICHSKTRNLPEVAREADILIAAIGKAAFVDDSFVKPGAVVIDVGMNRVDSADRIREIFGDDPRRMEDFQKRGYTLVGDVNPVKVLPVSSYLTPVPGGVGLLTIAMLMSNTVKAASFISEQRAADSARG
jgi:methylenetetrahydrofolate dehydrogenase (NADP+) / methenyltetrahydrofolate cyclohydrolase